MIIPIWSPKAARIKENEEFLGQTQEMLKYSLLPTTTISKLLLFQSGNSFLKGLINCFFIILTYW